MKTNEFDPNERYSDERLTADLTCGFPGHERAARILLDATDNPTIRWAIDCDARYMMNHVNERYSSAVSSCAQFIGNFASPMAQSIYAKAIDQVKE